ncbi:MAG: flagellar basal-body rod protein FlgG [Bacteriovoracaceae bacterium]|nr:flagellar basal-body rod protein FlgG [Bacteriovoracaceae bacterium]
MRALNTAATGMAAQEANVSTISNNIANVNTTGFKKARTEFEDLLYQTIQESGSRSSANTQYNVGTQLGAGAKVSATRKVFEQGSPQITKNPFDVMVSGGEGLFGIITPNNQVRYTRDGAFNVDAAGNLVTKTGFRVFPGITMPPGTVSVNITPEGKVDTYQKDSVEPNNIGSIPLFTFVNPVGLRSEGGNMYRATTASGAPIQTVAGESNSGSIQQGMLESSNVSIMNEMTSMIKAQRAYEMNSKVMGVADQMLQTANNVR